MSPLRKTAVVALIAMLGSAATLGAQQAIAEIGPATVSPAVLADLGGQRVVVKRSTGRHDYIGTDWKTFTTQKIMIPKGQQGMVIARLTGSFACSYNVNCLARIIIDDKFMHPALDGLIPENLNDYESFSIERSFGGIGAGEHQVRVEWRPAFLDDSPGYLASWDWSPAGICRMCSSRPFLAAGRAVTAHWIVSGRQRARQDT